MSDKNGKEKFTARRPAVSRCFQLPDEEVLQFGGSRQEMEKDYPRKAVSRSKMFSYLLVGSTYIHGAEDRWWVFDKMMMVAYHDEERLCCMIQIADN